MPRLLKTGVALALSCVTLAHAPQAAQAQSKSTNTPILKFGVPLLGPVMQAAPTSIRPVVDLNGLNAQEAQGQDSPTPSGIDGTSTYSYRSFGTLPDGKAGVVGQGKAQFITPPETIVLADISSNPQAKGPSIKEARVELTPDDSCLIDTSQPNVPDGIAPDNCLFGAKKRDNEVLAISGESLKAVNDFFKTNLSASYDNNTQILTIKGGTGSNDNIRGAYQEALKRVTYENKLPITGDKAGFDRDPQLDDRIITYVVDTDTDESNNVDGRFLPQDPGNPNQSKPAVLTLQFQEVQSLVVTTLSDTSAQNDNETSLREAIAYANSIPARMRPNPDPDPKAPTVPSPPSVITFAAGLSGTINLVAPLPPINANTNVTIQGPGARQVTINGSNAGGGIFQTASNTAISGLTLTGATAAPAVSADPNQITPPSYGGGIYNNGGTLRVDACTISGNTADLGGGIANVGGIVSVTNSSISGNTGGGIYLDNLDDGNVNSSLSNSTVSGNNGNGITQVAGSSATSLVTITNNAPAGVSISNGTASFGNTIISGNASDSDVTSNGGNYTSAGYNIIGAGNGSGGFSAANNDRVGITGNGARLSALGNNGGLTDTHALFAGSPAMDGGDPAFAAPPANDQRGPGFPRVFNARIDVGAFEKQNNDPVLNPVISPRNPTTNQTITVNANSDTTNLIYTFFVNGNQVQTGARNTLDLSVPGQGDRGQTILVSVTADNGSGTPTTKTDSVVVANSPAAFTTTITVTNPAPNSGSKEVLTNSVLTANVSVTDPDGSSFSTNYQWKVNGEILSQETGQTIDLSKPGNGDRNDTVSVDVTVRDAGGTPTTQTVSTKVGNTSPIANDVAFNVAAGQSVRVLLSATDVDTKQPSRANPNGVDNFFQFTKATNPTKGTATIVTNADGRGILIYTANANATGTDTLQFTATDSATFQNGALTVAPDAKTSAPATATARITGPTTGPTPNPTPSPMPTTNRPPAGASFSVNTQREVPIVRAIALSDPDVGDTYDTLQVTRLGGGLRKGTGGIRKDTDGVWKLFYKASRLYQGNDQVQYVVVDKQGAQSAPATITINIFNTKPTARNTKIQVAAGGSASIPIFGQDADNDTLTFERVGGPTKGTGEIRRDANGNYRFFYQNDPAAVGDDEVRFVSLDGNPGGVSDVATIEISVVGTFNRAPSAQNVTGTTKANTPIAVAVAGTDPDEGDTLTFKRVDGPNNGTGEIALDSDGIYKMFYTPRADYVGTETIRYVALDQKGRPSAPATITITVTKPEPSASANKQKSSPSAGSS